jgi:hypothetical protein
MKKDLLDRYKGQPLEDIIKTKGSKNNTNILKAFKAMDTYTIAQPPYSKYYGN